MSIAVDQWPPEGCPPLAWPHLPDEAARIEWYGAVIQAYQALWEGHVHQPQISPVDDVALDKLEQHLGCRLPSALRQYHSVFGALSLREKLCSVKESSCQIQPLLDAFPGIVDLVEGKDDEDQVLALADMLVAFGDYLGNGNMFCFHKESGEVYYFDHDDGPPLTRFFCRVEQYLDALMILNLAEVHDADDEGEALLVQRFGKPLVRQWMY